MNTRKKQNDPNVIATLIGIIIFIKFSFSFTLFFVHSLVGFGIINIFPAFISFVWHRQRVHLFIIHFNQFYFDVFVFHFIFFIHPFSYLFFSLHSCICSAIRHTGRQAHVQYNIYMYIGTRYQPFLNQRVFWQWVFLVLSQIYEIHTHIFSNVGKNDCFLWDQYGRLARAVRNGKK